MDYSLLLGIHNTRQLLELEPSPSYLLRPSQVENKDNGDRASHGAGAGDKPFYRATEGGMKAKIIEGPGIYFVGENRFAHSSAFLAVQRKPVSPDRFVAVLLCRHH